MTRVGENGRLGPGESWARAMAQVARAFELGSKRRYRVRARLVEPGWWAYEMVKISTPRPDPARIQAGREPLTPKQVEKLAAGRPRCVQRARATHGGDTKVAWPDETLAWRVAVALGHSAYRCLLPSPAIGEHWHTTSRRRKRRP